MGTAKELSTVSAADGGQPARKFDTPEAKSGLGTVAVASAHFLVALTLIKNLLWGEKSHARDSETRDEFAEPTSSLSSANDQEIPLPEGSEGTISDSQKPNGEQRSSEANDDQRGGASRIFASGEFPAEGFSPDPLGAAKASLMGSPLQLLPHPGNDNYPLPASLSGGGGQAPGAISGGGSGGAVGALSTNDKKTSDNSDKAVDSATPPPAADAGSSNPAPGGVSNPTTPSSPNPPSVDTRREDNRAPVITGNVVMSYLPANHAVLIGLSDLLRNASDPDGDELSVVELTASSGSLTNNGNGTWTFTPEPDSYVDVTFTYLISDGVDSVAQAAVLDAVEDYVSPPAGDDSGNERIATTTDEPEYNLITVNDSNSAEVYVDGNYSAIVTRGTSFADLIQGSMGNDAIYALKGNDIVHAGAGHDIVDGGEGDDTIFGDDGDDRLSGGDGHDTLIGGAGKDTADGGKGDDTFVATVDDGDDDYDGGEGSNTLDHSATTSAATIDLHAGTSEGEQTGRDTFRNIDSFKGGSGDETIILNARANTVDAGDGNDTIKAHSNDDSAESSASHVSDGIDRIDGGSGNDTFDAASTETAVEFNMVTGEVHGAETGHVEFKNVENFKGGSGNDVVKTDHQNNVIDTGGGHDIIKTSSYRDDGSEVSSDGDDEIHGGDGNDTVDMRSTSQTVDVNLKTGSIEGVEVGKDKISGVENVYTGSGDDKVTADHHANIIDTGDGNDIVKVALTENSASDGDDEIIGGAGKDALDYSSAVKDITVNLAEGTAYGEEIGIDKLCEIEDVTAGKGNDTLTADDENNVFYGGAGNDVMRSSRKKNENDDRDDGDDSFDGQDDSDTLDLSSTRNANTVDLKKGLATGLDIGTDKLFSIENVIGGSGDDVLIASRDANVFVGGLGNDTFVFKSVEDSPAENGQWDRIRDFTSGDKIDLSNLEVEGGKDGSFELVFQAPNTEPLKPAAGTIRYAYEQEDGREFTIIRAQTGDKVDEALQIVLDGRITLTANNFIFSDHENNNT